MGTILGDFIAQLSSHAMATPPATSSSSAPSSHAGAKDGGAAGSTSFAAGAGQDAYSGDKDSAAKKQTRWVPHGVEVTRFVAVRIVCAEYEE